MKFDDKFLSNCQSGLVFNYQVVSKYPLTTTIRPPTTKAPNKKGNFFFRKRVPSWPLSFKKYINLFNDLQKQKEKRKKMDSMNPGFWQLRSWLLDGRVSARWQDLDSCCGQDCGRNYKYAHLLPSTLIQSSVPPLLSAIAAFSELPCDAGTHMPLSCFACFACFHAHSSTVIIRDVSVFLCFASCVFRERGLSEATAAACKCFCDLVDFYVLRTHRSFGTTPSSLSAWMWESSQLSLWEIPLRINVKRENSFVSPQ